MHTGHEICKKISSMYPDIGECGAELKVTFDQDKNAWLVHMSKGDHELDHYLEPIDAEDCLAGKQCVSLGLEIAQMVKHVRGRQF